MSYTSLSNQRMSSPATSRINATNIGLACVGVSLCLPVLGMLIRRNIMPKVVYAIKDLNDRLTFSKQERGEVDAAIKDVNQYFDGDGDVEDDIDAETDDFDRQVVKATPASSTSIVPWNMAATYKLLSNMLKPGVVEAKTETKTVRRRHTFRMYIVAKVKEKCGGTPKETPAMIAAVNEMAVRFMQEHNHRAKHIIRDLPHISFMVFVPTKDELRRTRKRATLKNVTIQGALHDPESVYHH